MKEQFVIMLHMNPSRWNSEGSKTYHYYWGLSTATRKRSGNSKYDVLNKSASTQSRAKYEQAKVSVTSVSKEENRQIREGESSNDKRLHTFHED